MIEPRKSPAAAKVPWICPGCGKLFSLPLGKAAPDLCPNCRREHAEQAALAEFLADGPAPPPAAAEPVVKFLPATASQSPTFVRVVEVPAEPVWPQIARWGRRYGVTLGVGLLAGIIGVALGASVRGPLPEPIAESRGWGMSDVPGKERLFLRVTELVREQLAAQKTAEFADRYTVQPLASERPGKLALFYSGEVSAQNRAGTFITSPWTAAIHVSWPDGKVEAEALFLDGRVLFATPDFQRALGEQLAKNGNAADGLPEYLQTEIRNVDDKLRTQLAMYDRFFVLQWPGDLKRQEPHIFLNDDGVWQVEGSVRYANQGRNQPIFGQFRRATGDAIRLQVGDEWVVGGPVE